MSRQLGVDLTPLRTSAQYRRLYVAGIVTGLGTQASYVALPFQLKQLTHSPLDVGALGLAELLPLVVFGLYGGILADRLNRRTLILILECSMMLVTLGMLSNALLTSPMVWVLYLAAFLNAGIASLQSPSLSALNQTLVPHELQRAASTLGVISRSASSIVGPALGGIVAVAYGPQFVYGANILTFCGSLFLLSGLVNTPAAPSAEKSDRDALSEGVRFLGSRPDIVGTYIIDLVAMIFAFPVSMLPFVAERFHASYALSALYCGLPLGALAGTLASNWTRRVHHYGRAIAAAAAAWGLGIAVFGYASSLAIVVGGLVIAGAADAYSGIFRMTMWNESIRPDMRGRMAGMEMISYSLGPTAGQFRAGLMAAWTTMRFSLTFGGLACTGVVGAVTAALPSLWRFDARTNEHVADVRAIRARENIDTA